MPALVARRLPGDGSQKASLLHILKASNLKASTLKASNKRMCDMVPVAGCSIGRVINKRNIYPALRVKVSLVWLQVTLHPALASRPQLTSSSQDPRVAGCCRPTPERRSAVCCCHDEGLVQLSTALRSTRPTLVLAAGVRLRSRGSRRHASLQCSYMCFTFIQLASPS